MKKTENDAMKTIKSPRNVLPHPHPLQPLSASLILVISVCFTLYWCKQSACCHRTIHNNLFKEHHRKPQSRGCSLKTGFRYVQEVMFTSFELRLMFLCLSNRSMKVNYQISCRCSFVRKCIEWSWQSEHQENCGNLTY